MSKQSTSSVGFNAALLYRPGTLPPPPASSPTSANTGAPSASLSTKVNTKESGAEFIARMGLFDGQGKNPDILSIIIIVNLVAANPDIKELPLSTTEIATLRLKSGLFVGQLKAGLKREDPGRSGEWDKLDSDFIQMLLQYIVLQQDAAGNTYKEWIPICRDVRPLSGVSDRNPFYAYTIGVSKVLWNTRKLEALRKKERTTGTKGYADFLAIWLQFPGSEKARIREANKEQERAAAQEMDEMLDEASRRAREVLQGILDEQRNL